MPGCRSGSRTSRARRDVLLLLAASVQPTLAVSPAPICEPGVDMPSGNLASDPLPADSAAACNSLCVANASCVLFSWHAPGCHYYANECTLAAGCCWLKRVEAAGHAPRVDNCSCSGYVRLPPTTFVPSGTPGQDAKNVLYLLVDDLRPELAAYRQNKGHSPHIAALAASGTTFDFAFCQISVCSPSRMSFLTGRRPDHSRIVNFIDHFRQADCGLTEGGVAYAGEAHRTVHIGGCEWGGAAPCGGSGDCCSLCTEDADCAAWTYTHSDSSCALKRARGARAADAGAVSGARGTFATRASWVTLPQHFKNSGWLALSTGKMWADAGGSSPGPPSRRARSLRVACDSRVRAACRHSFHTEEGGAANDDPALNGPGMPPNEDPPSWSDGLSMQYRGLPLEPAHGHGRCGPASRSARWPAGDLPTSHRISPYLPRWPAGASTTSPTCGRVSSTRRARAPARAPSTPTPPASSPTPTRPSSCATASSRTTRC